jgi:hypothetical protein
VCYMSKIRRQCAGLFWGMTILLWISPVAQACRFNVREVGFVHFPEDAYYLYGLVRNDTPTAQVTAIEEKGKEILSESNIVFEMIRIDQEKKHPALEHLPMKDIQSYPAFVLVSPSPENHMKILSIPQADQPFSQRLQNFLENLILSPKRNEILKQIAEVYGFVLLFEGRDQEQNKAAAKVVDEVIEEVTEMLPNMPQPIYAPAPLEKGPVRIDISLKEADRENMLVWCFDLTERDPNVPHAVVVHGRGRIVGVPLAGEEIDAYTLGYFLSVIGADCECGLDRRWMQGRMIPLGWDESVQARLAKILGYDPENPMIMMEVARIVRRGYYPGGFGEFPRAADSQILGYQEIPIVVLEDEPNQIQPVTTEVTTTVTKDPPEQTTTTDGEPDKPKVKPAKLDIPMDPIPKQAPPQNTQKDSEDDDTDSSFVSTYRVPLIMGAIMVASILIGGIVIGLRNRGRVA